MKQMSVERSNHRYLPGIRFPDNLVIDFELDASLSGAKDVLVSVPSHGLRETLEKICL